MPEPLNFYVPTRVELGAGIAERLGERCRAAGYSSAFVVVDPGVRASGAADAALRSLEAAGIAAETWTDVEPNPLDTAIEAGAASFVADRRDVVVGIGGGSALDTAKGIAVLATNGGRLRDYAGNGNVPRRACPSMLLPTTAGTGSEVTANISVTDAETHDKLAVRDPNAHATHALLDPGLLAGLPVPAAAGAGMDALVHAIESYVSARATAFTRMLSFEATRRIGAALESFLADRADVGPAGEMLYASCLAGIAISHAGTGNAHALVRALGGLFGLPHGAGCGVALEPVMRFNASVATSRYAELAQALGVADPGDGIEGNARRTIERVGALRVAAGLPARLGVGLTDDVMPTLVQRTVANAGPNPRATGEADAEALIRAVAA